MLCGARPDAGCVRPEGWPASLPPPRCWTPPLDSVGGPIETSPHPRRSRTICVGVGPVDLDDALDGEGMLLPRTEALLVGCPPTFLEVSPSDRGLHVWGHGVVGRGRSMPWGAGRVEVYDRGRYMTVTGVRYDDAPNRLADVSGWVGELIG